MVKQKREDPHESSPSHNTACNFRVIVFYLLNDSLASKQNKLNIFVSEVIEITVNANSSREYSFTIQDPGGYIQITTIPIITRAGNGVTVGRNYEKNNTVFLWNNTDTTKDVGVVLLCIYQKQ